MASSSRRRKPTDEENFRGDYVPPEEPSEEGEEVDTYQPNTYKVNADHSVTRGTNVGMIDPSGWDMDKREELTVAPDNTEKHLRIISVRKGIDKNQNTYYMPTLEIMNEPDTKDLTDFISIPDRETMDRKAFIRAKSRLQDFGACFGADLTRAFDPLEDWQGLEGWCILGVTTSDQYGEQNKITRYILPK